jgi:hypothetical protein
MRTRKQAKRGACRGPPKKSKRFVTIAQKFLIEHDSNEVVNEVAKKKSVVVVFSCDRQGRECQKSKIVWTAGDSGICPPKKLPKKFRSSCQFSSVRFTSLSRKELRFFLLPRLAFLRGGLCSQVIDRRLIIWILCDLRDWDRRSGIGIGVASAYFVESTFGDKCAGFGDSE